jgi:hypothetical protein
MTLQYMAQFPVVRPHIKLHYNMQVINSNARWLDNTDLLNGVTDKTVKT